MVMVTAVPPSILPKIGDMNGVEDNRQGTAAQEREEASAVHCKIIISVI